MKITAELLEKYYKGLCTDEQEAEIKSWLLGKSNETIPDYLSSEDSVQVGDKIWKNIISHQNASDSMSPDSGKKVSFWLSGVAASLLVIAGLWVMFSGKNLVTKKEITYHTIKTEKGKRISFYLPDSSLIYLNASSEIRFPTAFEDSARHVTLTGEAFFKVTKDAKRPFTIACGPTQVRVLGTEFNLKSYKNENTVLTVKEGKVRFGKNKTDQHLILTAHQSAQYISANESLKKENVYKEGEFAWKENQLDFSGIPLSEIALVLERWYDIKILIKSPEVASRKFSGSYSNPPLETILSDMSILLKFNYKLTGNILVIQ